MEPSQSIDVTVTELRDLVLTVDTNKAALEAYALDGGRCVLLDTFEGDAVVRAEPFDAIELALAVLWEG